LYIGKHPHRREGERGEDSRCHIEAKKEKDNEKGRMGKRKVKRIIHITHSKNGDKNN
jgi:hypothetical protein